MCATLVDTKNVLYKATVTCLVMYNYSTVGLEADNSTV